jgi:hypothetical protein
MRRNGQTDMTWLVVAYLKSFENENKMSQPFIVPKKRTKKEVTSEPHGALNGISPPQKLM